MVLCSRTITIRNVTICQKTAIAVISQPIFVMRPAMSMSFVCFAMKPAAIGMRITVRMMAMILPRSTRHDGDPRHSVSSAVTGAAAAAGAE